MPLIALGVARKCVLTQIVFIAGLSVIIALRHHQRLCVHGMLRKAQKTIGLITSNMHCV